MMSFLHLHTKSRTMNRVEHLWRMNMGILQTKKLVFEYIEGFYNTIRVHSHCDYKSPNEYEHDYLISIN